MREVRRPTALMGRSSTGASFVGVEVGSFVCGTGYESFE